jgi:hypothetical protein
MRPHEIQDGRDLEVDHGEEKGEGEEEGPEEKEEGCTGQEENAEDESQKGDEEESGEKGCSQAQGPGPEAEARTGARPDGRAGTATDAIVDAAYGFRRWRSG